MWLNGDPKLLAYFFLNESSGVMLILLLVSFGLAKGTRRYGHIVTTLASVPLTIFLFPITRTPGDHFLFWRPQRLSSTISSINFHGRFLVDYGLSQFYDSVSLYDVDPGCVPHLGITRYITNTITGPPPSFSVCLSSSALIMAQTPL